MAQTHSKQVFNQTDEDFRMFKKLDEISARLDALTPVKYEALIGWEDGDKVVIARKRDTGQVCRLGGLLRAYHGSDGGAREIAHLGEIRSLTTTITTDTIFPPDYPYEYELEQESATEAFGLIEVAALVEEVDRVFLFTAGAWREGFLVENDEFVWRTA